MNNKSKQREKKTRTPKQYSESTQPNNSPAGNESPHKEGRGGQEEAGAQMHRTTGAKH